MTFEEYLENLEYQDIEDIETVLDPFTTVALRLGTENPGQKSAAENIDQVILDAPILPKPIFIYKRYMGKPEIRQGGTLIEKGFLYGTTKKPSTNVEEQILSVEVPAGTHAIRLPGDAYILARGTVLELETTSSGFIPAKIV